MPASLTLEWSYTPADFFETTLDYPVGNHRIHIEDGRAIATFVSDQPDSQSLIVHNELEALFLGAQTIRNRPFQLSNYSTTRTHPNGTAAIGLSLHETLRLGASFDLVHCDAAGNIIFDSKADRIREINERAHLAAKHINDLVAAALLKSYNKAINDPANELTHLYEIRDAVSKKFAGEKNACSTLDLSKNEWNRFGKLANDDPLYQGRHRGQNIGQLRDATQAELDESRRIARKIIWAYLNYLGRVDGT